jgi:hypothetical protein
MHECPRCGDPCACLGNDDCECSCDDAPDGTCAGVALGDDDELRSAVCIACPSTSSCAGGDAARAILGGLEPRAPGID